MFRIAPAWPIASNACSAARFEWKTEVRFSSIVLAQPSSVTSCNGHHPSGDRCHRQHGTCRRTHRTPAWPNRLPRRRYEVGWRRRPNLDPLGKARLLRPRRFPNFARLPPPSLRRQQTPGRRINPARSSRQRSQRFCCRVVARSKLFRDARAIAFLLRRQIRFHPGDGFLQYLPPFLRIPRLFAFGFFLFLLVRHSLHF